MFLPQLFSQYFSFIFLFFSRFRDFWLGCLLFPFLFHQLLVSMDKDRLLHFLILFALTVLFTLTIDIGLFGLSLLLRSLSLSVLFCVLVRLFCQLVLGM